MAPKKEVDLKAATSSYVQVLGVGTDTGTTVPSVLLFFDRQRYLFNAGEGFQRFCVEHKLKMSKMSAVLLTRTSTEASGGLPGMLLTMSDTSCGGLLASHAGLRVVGPPGLTPLINAFRTFMNIRDLGLSVDEFGAHKGQVPKAAVDGDNAANCSMLPPVVSNELVTILPVLIEACKTSAGRQHHNEGAPEVPAIGDATAGDGKERLAKRPRLARGMAAEGPVETVQDEGPAACYICTLPEIPGKFLPQKAASLGVPRGPLYGKLVKGEEVTAANGRVVKPADVMEPATPGPIVLVVDCPSHAFVPSLLAAVMMKECTEGNKRGRVACVVHLSPREVLQLPEYQAWLKMFATETSHILVAESILSCVPVQRKAAELQVKLNVIDAGLFTLHRNVAEQSMQPPAPLPDTCIVGRNMLRYHLRPATKQGLDAEECFDALDEKAVQQELHESKPEVVEAAKLAHAAAANCTDAVPACVAEASREEFEVTFLGTGASVPSKYRNVTGVHVNLFSKGGLLMDCGEGSYGQLCRRFGKEKADELICQLSCVWISHIHADHHIGLPSILAARTRMLGLDCPALPVFGPRPLGRALQAYAMLEPMRFHFFEASATSDPALVPHAPAVPDVVRSLIDDMRTGMGLARFESVPVTHCAHAYALVLESASSGWKLVFSGDTRPCENLVAAAKNATLLIHEATFDDSMAAEAEAKKHSTTADAVTSGAKAGAYRTLLTHFSQRYPKIPVVDEAFQEHYYQDAVGIAFDLMTVNLADLPRLPSLVPVLKLLFADEPEDVEPLPKMLT